MHSVTTKGRTKGWIVAGAVACAAVVGGYCAIGAAADKNSVEARLQAVEDRLAIEKLMVGDYPIALDTRNWKAYADLFTEDGELVQGDNVTKGRAAIVEVFSRPRPPRTPPAGAAAAAGAAPAAGANPAGPPQTKHIVSNLNIKLNGDTATATGYWETIAVRSTGTVIAGAGHYVDSLKKVNGEWKFSRREIVNPARTAGAAPAAPATPAR